MGEVKREPVNFDYEGLNWDFIKLQAEIAQRFGPVRKAEYKPMSLRAVFIATAKSNQKAS